MEIDNVINALSSLFVFKDIGSLHSFLRIEVSRSTDGLHLTQQKYIQDLFVRTNMKKAKAMPTPMSSTTCVTSPRQAIRSH